MNDIERIKELYKEYWDCMISKDIPGLDAMMTDDYVLMHSLRKMWRKNSTMILCRLIRKSDKVCCLALAF